MLLKPIALAAAGLAAATQAFLLPPAITESDVNVAKAIPEITDAGSSHHVNLPCPGCLVRHKGSKHGYSSPVKAAADRPVHLELTFNIRHEDNKQDKLLINTGTTLDIHEIYPDPMSDRTPMLGHLAFDEPSEMEKKLRGHRSGGRHRNQPLDYSLATFEYPVDKKDGLQLIDLEFQVLRVGNKFIEGIPTIHIKLVKDTATGALVIGSLQQTESNTKVPSPMDKQEECTSFMCKWFSIMKDKAEKMKVKCGGKAKTTHRPPPTHQHHGVRPYKSKHHNDGNRHSMVELFKNIATHIILPVAVGIIAGVTVSVIGMAIGSLIVTVWRVFFRRSSHRRRLHSGAHKAPKKEVVVADVEEKAGLMESQEDDQEAPPAYEDGARDAPV
jgi:hypothetical protein